MRLCLVVRVILGCWLLLVACGGFGTVRTIGKRRVGVQEHTNGALRLVSFVNVADSVVDADAGADFAMVLPGGDWLASVNGEVMRVSPDGTDVRWTMTGFAIWDAVAGAEGHVVAVGTITDPKALNGAARSLFALDTTNGSIKWRTTADPIERGASARLARVGTTTVAASAYGETAVDDSGKVRWTVKASERRRDPLLAPLQGAVVVLSTAENSVTDFTSGAPLRRPIVVRTLDVVTGEQRGKVELAAEHDYFDFNLGEIGLSADGRVALRAYDIRVKSESSVTQDGQPAIHQSTTSLARLVVIDTNDIARPSVRALAMPADAPAPMPASLAPSEVAFIDRYATDGGSLSLRIVDLATSRARRIPVLRTAKEYAYVQFTQLSVRPDQISFAGQFSGNSSPLKGRVEEVDGCEAQHGIECFDTPDTVTLAPTAGVIGTVSFRRPAAVR